MVKVMYFIEKIRSFLFSSCKTERAALPVRAETRPGFLLSSMEDFLRKRYEFRFNRLAETTEYRLKRERPAPFTIIGQRELNGLCIELHRQGIECWDRDISRYIHSTDIPAYHPFADYMERLPGWDGRDRIEELARRVSDEPVWINGFRRWMLGMAAQWMGVESVHANSVAPVLISPKQGMHKSTFCKLLVPGVLQSYYTDSFDLASASASEQKLALFGLINLDELDKYSAKKMTLLKNLMQMAGLNIRKAHKKHYSSLPRIASLIGTSNQKELLTDPTGSRRFLCVEVREKIDCSPIDYRQVYAQLKNELAGGERYWLTNEEEEEIMRHNAPYRKRGIEEDIFYQCYRLPEEGEAGELLAVSEIFTAMKKKYPAAMRGISVAVLSRHLIAIGVKRTHTRKGNRYHVITTG